MTRRVGEATGTKLAPGRRLSGNGSLPGKLPGRTNASPSYKPEGKAMRSRVLLVVLSVAWIVVSKAQVSNLPQCEWCGATEAPKDVSWSTVIAAKDEPGQPMRISGRVQKTDGAPAQGVILYVYHTNAKGIYGKKGDETGNGKRHGYLRGWMKTNARGEYEFTTIKPEPYPNGRAAAHVHVTVLEPGKAEYWIDSFLFQGDPLLSEQEKKQSGIVRLAKNREGMLIGTRDIVLPER